MKSYLYNSKVRNSYNGNTIYRLALKLTPQQWGKVKQYFKYYNFEGLKGWGTTNPYDVVRLLLEDENPQYQQLQEKITKAQTDIVNANGYLEAEDYNGLLTNLKYEQDRLVSSHIPF